MELIQSKEGLVATLTVKVSQEDYAAKVERELKKIRQTSQFKGFRPGNAPMSLIKKMYGQSILFEEIHKLVLESIENYEKENSEYLIGRVVPSSNNEQLTEFSEQKDFEFVYEAGFLPEFTYKIDENTELTYYNILINEKDIDEEITYYSNAHPILENLEVVEDDSIIKVNTTLIREGKEQIQSAYFSTSDIHDEYKSLFLGAKANDVINVEIRKGFTNKVDLMKSLELDEKEFEIQPETLPFTIVEISKKAPIGQEFFDMVAGKDNVRSEEELREYVRKNITSDCERSSLNKLYMDAVKVLKEKANVTISEDFVKKYIRLIQKKDMTDEQIEFLVKYFIDDTRWRYILNSLFKQANIEITDEMIKNEIRKIYDNNFRNNQDVEYEDLLNYYTKSHEQMQDVLDNIKKEKLTALLKEKAKLNVIDVTIDEFREICNTKNNDTDNQNSSETNESVKDESETEITETQDDDKEKQE